MAQHSDQVTVVIRSVGERTEALCHRLLAQQVPEQSIVMVRESPFTTAIAKTFQVGQDQDRPWTLVIDADTLVRRNALVKLFSIAQRADDHVFEIQAQILDKFFKIPKPAGNHLYRTALLDQALDLIPSSEESLRPETFVIKAMAARGYPWIQVDWIVGLHDYEQYCVDIYRKAFTHAHKHRRYATYFEKLWQPEMALDTDYKVALYGLHDGLSYDKRVEIDIRIFESLEVSKRLSSRGILEKSALPLTGSAITKIDHIIDNFRPATELWLYQFLSDQQLMWLPRYSRLVGQIGFAEATRFLAKTYLQRLTRKLGRVF